MNQLRYELPVEGMRCEHCKAAVEKAVSALKGVVSAEADLKKKRLVLHASESIDDSVIIAAVTAAGFEPGDIKSFDHKTSIWGR